MHTLFLNEISNDKIFEIHVEIGKITSIRYETSKIINKIFEIQIEICTIPSLLNEIFKIDIKNVEIQIEICTIPSLLIKIFKIINKIFVGTFPSTWL